MGDEADLGDGAPGGGEGEVSLEQSIGAAPAWVKAIAIKTIITITWGQVPAGVASSYDVSRVEVTRTGALNLGTRVLVGRTGPQARSLDDLTTRNNVTYVYLVNAVVEDPQRPGDEIVTGFGISKPVTQ